MNDITEIFIKILNENHSLDIADAEFKRMLAEDPQLKEQYNEWCHEHGSSFRNGFTDFCEEYIENRNSVWDSLTDYDE